MLWQAEVGHWPAHSKGNWQPRNMAQTTAKGAEGFLHTSADWKKEIERKKTKLPMTTQRIWTVQLLSSYSNPWIQGFNSSSSSLPQLRKQKQTRENTWTTVMKRYRHSPRRNFSTLPNTPPACLSLMHQMAYRANNQDSEKLSIFTEDVSI